MSKTVYFISGANRGIRYRLAAALAARPEAIVFAVKLTSGDENDNRAAIAEIQATAGQLDAVIANAAISKSVAPLVNTPISEFRDHWEVNTLGPIVLFQAAHGLLLGSPNKSPVFVLVSSVAGSTGHYLSLRSSPYGASKAAANFVVKTLHDEHPALIAFAFHPGWVATDMGMASARASNDMEPPHDIEDSRGLMARRERKLGVGSGTSKQQGATRGTSMRRRFHGNYFKYQQILVWFNANDKTAWP
ncbi:hypothetical protein DFH07DRAFT_780985 [Mycena maculata]|uniref:Uncharacterized protein n=1 Tax=Mycena maculata TaxID=230809 RepID=A0AAD7I066_9AGAR|nr:hypothetical protein DFH07DRAFT_780985 [Mycena maculata]